MTASRRAKLLILETSDRPGLVALAEGEQVCQLRRLDDARRNGRDLAPAVAELLAAQGWRPGDVEAVVVSRGPGSYTGLRVGIISAKTFAYATGCRLIAMDTFAAIARQAPPGVMAVDVLGDAQQDKVYVQPFRRTPEGWQPQEELAIRSFSDWLARRDPDAHVMGPGLRKWRAKVPEGVPVVEASLWPPAAESLAHLAWQRYEYEQWDDLWALEPLYLRPSSAEEQWQRR